MAWDDSKSTFQTRPDVPGDEKLTSTEWNAHVTDQQNRGYNDLTTVTSDYTASPQEIVLADASGGNVTVTLPAPEAAALVSVKRIDDGSANTVILTTPGGQTIDGETDPELSVQYEAHEITSDGTEYYTV